MKFHELFLRKKKKSPILFAAVCLPLDRWKNCLPYPCLKSRINCTNFVRTIPDQPYFLVWSLTSKEAYISICMRVQKRRFLCMFKSQVQSRLRVQIPLTDLRAIPGPGKKRLAPKVQLCRMKMTPLVNKQIE